MLSSFAVECTIYRAVMGSIGGLACEDDLDLHPTLYALLQALKDMDEECKPGLWLSCKLIEHATYTDADSSKIARVTFR